MLWFQMAVLALRIVWPHWFAPWRSPLLRWRMETYGMLDARGVPMSASEITPADFWRFSFAHRQALVRFLRWAVLLEQQI